MKGHIICHMILTDFDRGVLRPKGEFDPIIRVNLVENCTKFTFATLKSVGILRARTQRHHLSYLPGTDCRRIVRVGLRARVTTSSPGRASAPWSAPTRGGGGLSGG